MSAGEAMPSAQAISAVCQGKAMRARSRAKPRRMISAAFSADMKNGIGKSLASVMRLFTKPGITTLTFTPRGASSPRRDSPQTLTAALLYGASRTVLVMVALAYLVGATALVLMLESALATAEPST